MNLALNKAEDNDNSNAQHFYGEHVTTACYTGWRSGFAVILFVIFENSKDSSTSSLLPSLRKQSLNFQLKLTSSVKVSLIKEKLPFLILIF